MACGPRVVRGAPRGRGRVPWVRVAGRGSAGSIVRRRGGEGRGVPGGRDLWVGFESEGGEGRPAWERVGVLAGEGVEDGGAAPGGESEVGGADAVGVEFGVLDVDAAGDGGVEVEAELVVDAGTFGAVAA